jgi:hypothetical protein
VHIAIRDVFYLRMHPLAAPGYVGPALAAIGIGAALLARGAHRFRRTRRSAAWRVTDGVIVSSGLTPPMLRPAPPRPLPAVRYRYEVAGRSFEGWFEHTRVEYDDADAGAQVVARYPVGSPLRIWYDPTAPERAVAEATTRGVAGRACWSGRSSSLRAYGSPRGRWARHKLGLRLMEMRAAGDGPSQIVKRATFSPA